MEMTKEDFELFIQFKQFMALQGSTAHINASTKKTRREKGTGSIVKLSGKRRRPYLAAITIGYDDYDGHQMQKPLAYFRTHNDANKALDLYLLEKEGKCNSGTVMEYIASVDGAPSNCVDLGITLNQEVYKKGRFVSTAPTFAEIWQKVYSDDLEQRLSKNTKINYRTAFKELSALHAMKIDTIKLEHIQPIFDEVMERKVCSGKLNLMKIVCKYVFDYAFKYDMIKKNYAQFISYKETKEDRKPKEIYSKELIRELFARDDDIYVQSILVMIYTGLRPREFLELKKENIHLEERYMIGGKKTKNGIDRTIPIHHCIEGYVKNIMNSKVLGMPYPTYINCHYNKIKKELKFECTPHSGRHTFATLANEYELNEFLIKRIMGHTTNDLTKDVYTRTDKERLIKEIDKLPDLR